MNPPLKISLVIPAYNEEKYIKACLESIEKNSRSNGVELLHEIIVVDNASTDKTGDVARAAAMAVEKDALSKILSTAPTAKDVPKIVVVKEEKKGTSAARQRGFEESTGDIIAFIDADCHMPAGWCEKVLKEFSKDQDLAVLSGPYIYYDMPLWQRSMIKIFWRTLAYPFYMMTQYMAMGGNLVIRKSVLEKMGGLDTSITFYGDDTDIARRASKFGRVKFKFNFTIESSARRFHGQGLFKTLIVYSANFFSQVLAKKSITKDASHDIR